MITSAPSNHATPGRYNAHRGARGSAAVLSLTLLGLTACGGTTSPCDPVERTVESAGSHILAGGVATYEFKPPSSGLHTPPGLDGGVRDEPIAEPTQVASLEIGRVILQYSADLPADAVADLEAFASADVIVAPASEIDDDRLVAFTAWGKRQRCDDVSVPDARAFLRDGLGSGPGGHE